MLVAGLLGVAGVGLALSTRRAYIANRNLSHGWLLGIVSIFAAEGARISRVFAAIGLVHSMYEALQFVERVAKSLLTTWGTMILEVRRQ